MINTNPEIPKFFIPESDNKAEEIILYNEAKSALEKWSKHKISDRRIYSINYNHNGRDLTDTVGQIGDDEKEMVFCIFEGINQPAEYFVCTMNRGIKFLPPIQISAEDINSITDFSK